MQWPEFTLKNVPEVIGLLHETGKSTLGVSGGSTGANSPQPPPGSDSRIAQWACAAGRCLEKSEFSQKLEGRQVDRELNSIFRETPEFGRSLALRLADFHESRTEGNLTLIGGGGEAVVFFEPEIQSVVKLLGGAGKAGFGWMVDRDAGGQWILRPGGLAEALMRFWLAEQSFPTGLDIDSIGVNGEFLLLTQPFLVGENPDERQLSDWMAEQGWERFSPSTELEMMATQTWKRASAIVTDVRAENAILADVDAQIYPFDFIAAWIE